MELNRYRIGNDVPLKWTITRGDEPEDLTIVESVRVFIVCPMWECEVPYIIGGADNNEVTVLFKGKEQKYCGPYWLRLEENRGEDNMNTIESRAAFELRPVTDTAAIMPVAVTELATDIMMPGHGLSAYQIAVLHGYQGTEEEWLAGIVGREGVNDYSLLASKPKINGHELVGDKGLGELGIFTAEEGDELKEEVDALSLNQDVKRIFGRAEDLDPEGLEEGNQVRVLADENHLGATTVYTYKNESFVFVGGVGPYYTKGEIDASVVKTTDQSLNEEKKKIARQNISAQKSTPIIVHTNEDVIIDDVECDVLHKWQYPIDSLSVRSLREVEDDTIAHEYMFRFTTSADWEQEESPFEDLDVAWTQDPVCYPDSTYEVSIMDGVGILAEIENE